MLPMGVDTHIRNPQRRRVSTQVSSWGNFTPMALGADGWWDASDTSTLTQSGTAVSQWNDKSGWNRHFVQATAANQPVTGSNTQNGLTTITFDGSNDGMTANGGANGKLFVSMFTVAKFLSNNAAQNSVLTVGGAGTLTTLRLLYREAGNTVVRFSQWGANYGTSDWDIAGSFHVFGFVQNSTTSVTIVRDRTIGTGNPGTMATIGNNNVEVGFTSTNNPTWAAPIAVGEIVLFYRTLTIQERVMLTDYFSAKWGLKI